MSEKIISLDDTDPEIRKILEKEIQNQRRQFPESIQIVDMGTEGGTENIEDIKRIKDGYKKPRTI